MADINFINECKNRANANRLGKITVDGATTPINNSNNLQSFSIDSGCYVNGSIIGSVYSKCLNANFIADENNLVDKKIQAHVGVKYASLGEEYINLGKYTVERPNNEITANMSQIKAYDDLYTNLDSKYVCGIDFTQGVITIADLYLDVCRQLKLTPNTTTFLNSNIPIEANPFTNGEKNRTVLQTIAKISCSFIDIDNDTNKIDLCWLSQNEEPNYTFYKNDYVNVEGGQIVCGPINCLIIKNSSVDDENVTIKDEDSIALYGEHSITISEDYILYNAELRQQAITTIWNRVRGMKYVDCKLTTYYGKPFLKLGDKIRIYISETEYFDTYVLKHNFTYDGTFSSIIESPALTEQEIKNKQDIGLKEALMDTQIKINKQEGKITELVEKTDEYSDKLAQQQITIDTIEQLVSGEYGLDRETSISKTIHIDNANESKPLDLKIYGYSQPHLEYYFGIDYLGLSYLMSDKEEEMPKITLCIDKQPQNNPSSELKQIELNIVKPLRSLKTIKDELHISLNKETKVFEVQITRYLDYVNGHVVKLKTPLIEFITIEDFQLFEKTNYIYIKENYNYSLYLRYLVYSELNKNYATKVELSSSIKQLENEVTIKVEEKLDSKDFTSAEIFAKINNDESEAGIKADKIKLEGLTTINEHFKIDKEGKMSCDDADIVNSILSNVTIKNGHLTFDSNDGTFDDYFLKYTGSGFLGINAYGYHQEGLGASIGDPTVNTIMGIDLNMANYHSMLELTDWWGNICHVGTDGILLDGPITCQTLTQTSLESKKKNIERFKNGLDLIKNSDIYTFHYKREKDDDKKHIGLVIGEKYNTTNEVISQDGNSIDLYSMIGIAWQTIKELNQKIETLEKRIEELEGEKNG